jgi:hypothetical protein
MLRQDLIENGMLVDIHFDMLLSRAIRQNLLQVERRGRSTSELHHSALKARGCFERLRMKTGEWCLHVARELSKPFFMRYRVEREERSDDERNVDSEEDGEEESEYESDWDESDEDEDEDVDDTDAPERCRHKIHTCDD